MKSFLIGGSVIDDSAQAWAFEDVTPSQVRAFLSKIEPGEDVTFDISSPGGSVTAGIAIANLIKDACKTRKCRAHVVGIAASMASVIACACDEIDLDESAFMMIHNPWAMTDGDADDLRRSADVLDQMKAAIISFYRSKFDRSDDELSALMDAETWFTGSSAADFGFKANVIASAAPLKAAACARHLPNFNACPSAAEHLFVLATERDGSEPADESQHLASPVHADSSAGQTTADQAAEVSQAAAEPAAQPDFTARLAAAMKSRDTEINELKAKVRDIEQRSIELVAKTESDFKNQLAAKDKELTEAKAEVTRLAAAVESAQKELRETASALSASNDALATLNAAVNTPNATRTRTVSARAEMASLPPSERPRFYREHAEAVDLNQTITIV